MIGGVVSDPRGSGSVMVLGLGFFLAGCVLLVTTDGSLATLHAFAAFVVLAAVAASNQLIPVLTRAPTIPAGPVIAVGCAFAVGFGLLIAGFRGAPTFGAAGTVLVLTAIVWVGWTVSRLFAGRAEGATRWALGLALTAFACAAVLGAGLATSLQGALSPRLLELAPAHAVLAIGGFATVLVIAVSYRFVPMFSIAHGTAYGRKLPQWIAIAAFAGIATYASHAVVVRVLLAIVLACIVWIAESHLRTIATRARRRLDVSLRFAAVAWSFAFVATACAIAGTWYPEFAPASVALAVLGWLCLSILGYAFKVLGFLAWQMARARDAHAKLPPLGSTVDERLALIGLGLLAIGAIGTAGGYAGAISSTFAHVAYAAGACATVGALGKLVTSYVPVRR